MIVGWLLVEELTHISKVEYSESEKDDIVWSEEYMYIDVGLDKFGVDVKALQPVTVCSR